MANHPDSISATQLESGGSIAHSIEKDTGSEDDGLIFDGGRAAWLTLAGGWITCFTTMGFIGAFGVFVDLFSRSQAASPSAISWIGSTQNFLLTAVAAVAGRLLDAGHFKITMLSGSALFVLGIFMFSLAHWDAYYQLFLTLGLMVGVGGGTVYLPAIAIQTHHWRKYQALAIGVVGTGSSVGGIVFPIMLNKLISESSVGFAWGVRYTGFFCLGLLAIANALMTSRPSPAHDVIAKEKSSVKMILKDVPYDLMILGCIVADIGYLFPVFYLQLFAILHGVSESLAFATLSIMSGSAIIGRVLPNLLADRFGAFNVGVPVIFLMSVLIFVMFGVTNSASAVVFAVLYGMAFGGFFSVYAPMCISFAQHPGEIGIRMGIAYSLAAIGTLVGTPIVGALLTENYHWSRGIIFSAGICLAGTSCVVAARQLLAKRKGTQRV